jgi:hypothetical protein
MLRAGVSKHMVLANLVCATYGDGAGPYFTSLDTPPTASTPPAPSNASLTRRQQYYTDIAAVETLTVATLPPADLARSPTVDQLCPG